MGTSHEAASCSMSNVTVANCTSDGSSMTSSFSMSKTPVAKRTVPPQAIGAAVRKVPKVRDIEAANKREVCPALIVKPPDQVLSYFQPPVRHVIGFDVETHDWEDDSNKKGEYGVFGFYTLTTPKELLHKRMAQIGWAIGEIDIDLKFKSIKQRKIQPDGFRISEKAAKYHGITNACAANEGVPLASALTEFLTDVFECVNTRQGRVISHHMHHDAMIIMHELERTKMSDMVTSWKSIARAGICTMDPCIGKWVYAITIPTTCGLEDSRGPTARQQTNQKDSSKPTLSLDKMVEWLLPGQVDWKQRAHRADADAEMHCQVYYELAKLVSRARD